MALDFGFASEPPNGMEIAGANCSGRLRQACERHRAHVRRSLQAVPEMAQSTKSMTAPSRRSRKPANWPKFGAVTLLYTALKLP